MKAYHHCAQIIGNIRAGVSHAPTTAEAAQLNNVALHDIPNSHLGFKNAFYQYTEANEQHIGSQVNRVYSMCINIYRRLKDIEMAVREVFSDSYEAEVRQPNMLIVLIYDHVVMGQKLKIGGKLARMVKDNKDIM